MSRIIVDGHNLLFKSFAVPFKFTSSKGTPLHVVSTYLKYLRLLSTNYSPDEFFVVFDTETSNTNKELSSTYKANRVNNYPDQESPFIHLPIIKRVLEFCNIATIDAINYEADDVIATLTERANTQTYICSTDTDFFQLLSQRVSILKFKPRMIIEEITPEKLSTNLGISPQDYVFFKSLTGDTADNIKGIPGVGKVRAKSILEGKLSINLDEYRDLIELNKQLITLDRNVPLPEAAFQSTFSDTKLHLSNREIWTALEF